MIHSANPCRHPTVHSRKLGDTASHSSLSTCGLALLTVAYQALTIVSMSTSMEAATNERFQVRCLSPNPRPAFNTSKSKRSFFPIQQGRSSWWSLIKPFQERSHHLGHGLSHVLSLMHPHACHQVLLDRVTACVSYTENTTKLCGCGKSRMHYLGHCCHTAILHSNACCAMMCKLKLSLRCVLSGCTVTSHPPCIYQIPDTCLIQL